MGEIHWAAHLPKDVHLLDSIGTLSGNPTTAAAYGFMSSEEPPRYATGYVIPRLARGIAERKAAVAGPFDLEEYTRLSTLAEATGPDTAAFVAEISAAESSNYLFISSNVGRYTSTEALIGSFVHLAFDYDK